MPTRSQLALLHLAAQRLGLDDEAYRALLASVGVKSATELTNPQLDAVMQALRGLGFVDARPRRAPLGERGAMATDAQLAKVRALWEQFSGREDDEAALRRWVRRFRVSDLRFLDAGLAPKVIAALRNMIARRQLAAATDPTPVGADASPTPLPVPGRGRLRVGRVGQYDPEALAYVDAQLRGRMAEDGSFPHGAVRDVYRAGVAALGLARAVREASVRTRARQLGAAVRDEVENRKVDRAAADARALHARQAEQIAHVELNLRENPTPPLSDVRAMLNTRLADAAGAGVGPMRGRGDRSGRGESQDGPSGDEVTPAPG